MKCILLARILAAAASLCCASAGTANASTAVSPSSQTKGGLVIAQRMLRVVQRQPRVEAAGELRSQTVPPEHLRFRYLAPARESIVRSGGGLGRVQIAGRPVSMVREISIGKTLYRTLDGRHWLHAARAAAPSPLDAFTLNDSNAMCCNVIAGATGTSVTFAGVQSTPGGRAYILDFRTAAAGQVIATRVMVSAKSYLPLSYTSTTQPGSTVSRLSFRYHGSFSIRQPR